MNGSHKLKMYTFKNFIEAFVVFVRVFIDKDLTKGLLWTTSIFTNGLSPRELRKFACQYNKAVGGCVKCHRLDVTMQW